MLNDFLSIFSVERRLFGDFYAYAYALAFIEIVYLFWLGQTINWRQQISSVVVRVIKVLLSPLRVAIVLILISPVIDARTYSIKPNLFSWVAIIVIGDFLYYIFHRLSHTVRFFWAQHYVHHTFTQMCFVNGMRNQVFNIFWAIPSNLILVLLGFQWKMILAQVLVNGLFQFASHFHKPIRYPFYLDRIFVSPAFHYIHHQIATGGKNLGAIFVFWDHLFGTFSSDNRNPQLGISYNHNPQNVWAILFYENFEIIKDLLKARDFRSSINAFIKMKPFEKIEEQALEESNRTRITFRRSAEVTHTISK